MENMKKEILRILFVFGVQVIVGFLFSFFTKASWNLKAFLCNDMFLIFWGAYFVCIIAITVFKKIKAGKSES